MRVQVRGPGCEGDGSGVCPGRRQPGDQDQPRVRRRALLRVLAPGRAARGLEQPRHAVPQAGQRGAEHRAGRARGRGHLQLHHRQRGGRGHLHRHAGGGL